MEPLIGDNLGKIKSSRGLPLEAEVCALSEKRGLSFPKLKEQLVFNGKLLKHGSNKSKQNQKLKSLRNRSKVGLQSSRKVEIVPLAPPETI